MENTKGEQPAKSAASTGSVCPECLGTGWVGDNGPGIAGNKEYAQCECVIERRYIDRDLFVAYVETEVNPAREKEGLPIAGKGVAAHLYDVLRSGRYRVAPNNKATDGSSVG